jgi:hypothetical protein
LLSRVVAAGALFGSVHVPDSTSGASGTRRALRETDKIWGMRQGAVENLVKPIAERQLVDMINSVMAA